MFSSTLKQGDYVTHVVRPLRKSQGENARPPSRACDLLQRVEARPLLAAQRGIEFVQGGLDQVGGVSMAPLN